MTPEQVNAQRKLARRLRRQFACIADCMSRSEDMLDEAGNDTFELGYVVKQIDHATEFVSMAKALICNAVTEWEVSMKGEDGPH